MAAVVGISVALQIVICSASRSRRRSSSMSRRGVSRHPDLRFQRRPFAHCQDEYSDFTIPYRAYRNTDRYHGVMLSRFTRSNGRAERIRDSRLRPLAGQEIEKLVAKG